MRIVLKTAVAVLLILIVGSVARRIAGTDEQVPAPEFPAGEAVIVLPADGPVEVARAPMPREIEVGPMPTEVTVGPMPRNLTDLEELARYQQLFMEHNRVAGNRRFAPFTNIVPMQYPAYQEVYADEPLPPLLPGQRGYLVQKFGPSYRRPGGPAANRPNPSGLSGGLLSSPATRGLFALGLSR